MRAAGRLTCTSPSTCGSATEASAAKPGMRLLLHQEGGHAVTLSPACSCQIHYPADGVSDTGGVRQRNEDCFSADDRLSLFVVADGMGGHVAGDVASRVAVDIDPSDSSIDRTTPTISPGRADLHSALTDAGQSRAHRDSPRQPPGLPGGRE